ncbi:hypothetical protein KP509_1Z003400 [Ceratopteris richardii]|nr:hypothetical protein KP509_1Z003400 [Ceratopteris richardii]
MEIRAWHKKKRHPNTLLPLIVTHNSVQQDKPPRHWKLLDRRGRVEGGGVIVTYLRLRKVEDLQQINEAVLLHLTTIASDTITNSNRFMNLIFNTSMIHSLLLFFVFHHQSIKIYHPCDVL